MKRFLAIAILFVFAPVASAQCGTQAVIAPTFGTPVLTNTFADSCSVPVATPFATNFAGSFGSPVFGGFGSRFGGVSVIRNGFGNRVVFSNFVPNANFLALNTFTPSSTVILNRGFFGGFGGIGVGIGLGVNRVAVVGGRRAVAVGGKKKIVRK